MLSSFQIVAVVELENVLNKAGNIFMHASMKRKTLTHFPRSVVNSCTSVSLLFYTHTLKLKPMMATHLLIVDPFFTVIFTSFCKRNSCFQYHRGAVWTSGDRLQTSRDSRWIKQGSRKLPWFLVDRWSSFFLQHQRLQRRFDVAACCLRYRVNEEMSSCKVPL